MDEKMANSGGAFFATSFLDTGKNWYIDLAVLLFAGDLHFGRECFRPFFRPGWHFSHLQVSRLALPPYCL